MILGFKTKFKDGNPTHFPQQILSGIKKHSLREDKHDRWKPCMKIHMATGIRTKNYNQFNKHRPDMEKCKSTQEVWIYYSDIEHGDGSFSRGLCHIVVDGKHLHGRKYQQFIKNDGFPDPFVFKDWFNKEFKGKIIHWTDLKY